MKLRATIARFLSVASLAMVGTVASDIGDFVPQAEGATGGVVVLSVTRRGILFDNATFHMVNITIGGNSQSAILSLDTSTSSMYVNSDCEIDFPVADYMCRKYPKYDPGASDTSELLNPPRDRTPAKYADNVKIGNLTLEKYDFFVRTATESTQLTGRLGLAHNKDSIASDLVARGVINSNAFGFNPGLMNKTGSLIFGGIDTKKYRCHLERFQHPVLDKDSRDRILLGVEMTGASLTLPGMPYKAFDSASVNPYNYTYPRGIPYVTRSETVFSAFPARLFHAIGKSIPGAQYEQDAFSEQGKSTTVDNTTFSRVGYSVPCSPSLEGTISFTFGQTTHISVPLSSFVVQQTRTLCLLAMTATNPEDLDTYAIGSVILDDAYMAFDWANYAIWFGELDDCGSNIVPVDKGKDAFPVMDGCNCPKTEHPQDPKDDPKDEPKKDQKKGVAAPSTAYLSPSSLALVALLIAAVTLLD